MMIRPQSMINAWAFSIGYWPSEMTAVVLLRNGQIEEKIALKDSARIFLDDPQAGVKLQDAARACRDYMCDRFGGQHNIGVELTRIGWVLAAVLDDYTIVAIAEPGPYPPMVDKWLKRMASLLTSSAYAT